MSTKHFLQIAVVVASVGAIGLAPVLAQESGQGTMERDHMGGMMGKHRGMRGGMMGGTTDEEMQENQKKMDKKMEEIGHHMKMMEGIKNPDEMMTEMRKHMQMMTDMMEEITRQEGKTMGRARCNGCRR